MKSEEPVGPEDPPTLGTTPSRRCADETMILAALSEDSLAELRQVLDTLVGEARRALGANFCGAYLVGSFALAAGDEHSDVDFLIVTERDLDPGHVESLREVHAGLPDRGAGWAQHLEGGYVPRAQLRASAVEGQAWWYVDNGSRELVLSSHDNSEVGRWVLREHGIVLAGPDPVDLLEPVGAARLRAEALATLERWRTVVDDDAGFPHNALSQQQHVLALCRVLCTLTAAVVVSKASAGRWALGALDATWADLITTAIENRPRPWERVGRAADPALARRTREFADYANAYGRSRAVAKQSSPSDRGPGFGPHPSSRIDRATAVRETSEMLLREDCAHGGNEHSDPLLRDDSAAGSGVRSDTWPPRRHARRARQASRRTDYDATEPLVIAEVRRLISRGEGDRLTVSDLLDDDLDRIPWSGGPRHPIDVGEALRRRAVGEVDYLAVRAPNGWPVSIGGVDYTLNPDAGTLWQLGTHSELRSLGLGTRLITAAENRIRRRSLRVAVIGVEDSNRRAHALYSRLGYSDHGHEHASWDEVDEDGTARAHHAEVILMRTRLDDPRPAVPD